MRTKILSQDDFLAVVSIDEAMEHSRITDTYDEIVVQQCLDAAHDLVQQWLNRRITNASVIGQVESYRPQITLPYPPVHQVTEVVAEDVDGSEVKLTEGTHWKFDEINESIRFIGTSVAIYTNYKFNYLCGYCDDKVPRAVKHAILMTFATLYENREDVIIGTNAMPVPLRARRILATHRVRSHI